MPIQVRPSVDVAVAGGGPAGICAALAAARTGARTLLVEQLGNLGGVAALGGLPLLSLHNNREEQIVGGIPWDFIQRLMEVKGAFIARNYDIGGHDGKGTPRYNAINLYVLPEPLKYLAALMCQEAGVEVLLHTQVADVVKDGDALAGLVVVNKSGTTIVQADRVIDCTGDGDVAARAGAPFEKGRPRDGAMQPMTPLFLISGVDIPKAMAAGSMVYRTYEAIDEYWAKHWQSYVVQLEPYMEELQQALGGHRIIRFNFNDFGQGAYYAGNFIHVARRDSSDGDDLSRAETEARLLVWRLIDFVRRRLPGFERCELLGTPAIIGIRESRRILGDYYMTLDDVLEARRFNDVVARCGYWVDIHEAHGGPDLEFPDRGSQVKDYGDYDIPYRCLMPQRVDNLLVAGRCISGSHEAHSSYRVMGTAMALGHAAGAAAALSMQQGVSPRQLPAGDLQETLLAQGALLGERFARTPAPEPQP
jgi:hypothetical protein